MGRDVVCVDLFCGCGGLTRGLRDAGIRVIKGVDMDGTARETYERNNPGSAFVQADLRDVSSDEIVDGVERNGSDLLLAGCAPCQPFSKHTTGEGHDERRSLVRCMARMVEDILPEYVLMENVPGFDTKSNTYRAELMRVLNGNKYEVDDGVVNAADYGVPQARRRYVLLASRKGSLDIPAGVIDKPRSVRNTIFHFPKIRAGESHWHVKNHVAPALSETNMERIKATRRDGGSMRDIPRSLWARCHRGHDGHTDTYGRMRWDGPAPTLTCRCTSFSNGRFGHPSQDRAISVREAAALQTFPDDYVFHSRMTANSRHIGNAVPVLVARAMGEAIIGSQK